MTEKELLAPGDDRRPSWIPKSLTVWKDGGAWRDSRWNQYVLPDPKSGVGRTFQRATTFISMAEYKGDGLTDYSIRHALAGLMKRPDLLVRAAKLELPDKHSKRQATTMVEVDDARSEIALIDWLKEQWKELSELAHDASGGNVASRNGDEIHAMTEVLDKGEATVDNLPTDYLVKGIPADLTRWRKHGEAYLALKDKSGFQTFPELVERQVVNTDYGVAGTFDRLVLIQLEGDTEPRWRLLDVKSGDVDFRDKFGRQMFLYATADGMWNEELERYDEFPDDIDTEVALVVHLPWWDENPVASLIPISMTRAGGAEGLDACTQVKQTRGMRAPTMKTIATASAPVVEPVAELVPAEVLAKIPAPRKRAARKPKVVEATADELWIQDLLKATSRDELKDVIVKVKASYGDAGVPEEVQTAAKKHFASLYSL